MKVHQVVKRSFWTPARYTTTGSDSVGLKRLCQLYYRLKPSWMESSALDDVAAAWLALLRFWSTDSLAPVQEQQILILHFISNNPTYVVRFDPSFYLNNFTAKIFFQMSKKLSAFMVVRSLLSCLAPGPNCFLNTHFNIIILQLLHKMVIIIYIVYVVIVLS